MEQNFKETDLENNVIISKEEYESLKNDKNLPQEESINIDGIELQKNNEDSNLEQEKDNNYLDQIKLRHIRIASYWSLALSILFFGALAWYFSEASNLNPYLGAEQDAILLLTAPSIMMIITGVLYTILSLYIPIKILATSWKNNSLENSKILWGLLSLLLLGWIGGLIFGYTKI